MSGARGQEQPHSYLWDREVLMNLVIMSYMWSACSFCYYLLLVYIKYLPGSLYENGVMMSVAEMVGAVCSGIVMKTAGLKISLISLMIVSLAGGLMILFLGESHLNWMPFFVLLAKFGVSGMFNINYACTLSIFPTLFNGTALGICNFLARILTIFSPLVAEKEHPVPMVIFSIMISTGILLVNFLKLPQTTTVKKQD